MKNIKKKIFFINSQFSTNNNFNGINNLVTLYETTIMLNRDDEKKPPETIGICNINEFNVRLGLYLNKNPFDTIKQDLEMFLEFNNLINKNISTINKKYDRVLFVHNLLVKEEYKKSGITEEFVKHIYRTLYNEKTLIIFLIKPIQLLKNTFFMYRAMKNIVIKTKFKAIDIKEVSANKYFKLDELSQKYNDLEGQTYKLYSLAQSCGLKMFDDSPYMFYISEKKIINLINKIDE